MFEDNYRHIGLRKKLVGQLRDKGIKDENVLQSIERVPRHFFMDTGFLGFAYKDSAFPIGAGQTISQPYTVAFQSELLEVQEGDRILEIGTGSGYQTAVLLEMGARVFSIERQYDLFRQASELLENLDYSADIFYGDGYLGKPQFAPYDHILVTAGAPSIPEALKMQLKIGGSMVIPVGNKNQIMIKCKRLNEHEFEQTEHGHFVFVPLLEGMNR